MIIVALPAYNEEIALPPLLDSIAQVRQTTLPDLRVIVVDDGSADATADIVRQHHKSRPWITLVQHERNQGLSQAIRTGFQAALEDAGPGDIVVTLDADNTQPPDIIPNMVDFVSEGCDVVIASRFQPGAEVHGVPPLRRFYSRAMGVMFRFIFPIRGVRDYSCGFRAYRVDTLRRAYATYGDSFITEQGFACMVEILCQLGRLGGVTFGEVPFILRYDLKPTATKMRVMRTIYDTLRVGLRYRFAPRPDSSQ
ncbi:MAG: glycosyltransferase family 2 protein [Anaerolineae bacterium]|nr:glycosyltransferase family 2 protein [Anaerolineae bacterium]